MIWAPNNLFPDGIGVHDSTELLSADFNGQVIFPQNSHFYDWIFLQTDFLLVF